MQYSKLLVFRNDDFYRGIIVPSAKDFRLHYEPKNPLTWNKVFASNWFVRFVQEVMPEFSMKGNDRGGIIVPKGWERIIYGAYAIANPQQMANDVTGRTGKEEASQIAVDLKQI